LILPAFLLLEIKHKWNSTANNSAVVTDQVLFAISLAFPARSRDRDTGCLLLLAFSEIGRLL
jgi:hypothetical protein